MAGMSRSEYLRSQQSQKKSPIKAIVKLVLVTASLFLVPQLLIFILGLWIIVGMIFGAWKSAIDLPDYK